MYSAFAAAILTKRIADDATLRQVADLSGVPISTCYRAEAVADKLDLNTVINLCNWLGMPLQMFLEPKEIKLKLATKSGLTKRK